jgi:hypothetical protein
MDADIVEDSAFSSFEYIPSRRIVGSYDYSATTLPASFSIPTNSTQGFQFPDILTNTCYLGFF